MTYMSSIERIGMEIGMKKGEELGKRMGWEKGLREGRREALEEMLTLMLSQRFGELDAVTSASLAVADADQLTAWAKNFVGAGSLSDVFAEK